MKPDAQRHNPVMVLYRKYGSLAYRLAHAMVGDKEVASDVVASVFAEVDAAGTTAWYDVLASIHARCCESKAQNATSVTAAVSDTEAIPEIPYSSQSIYLAYCNLPEPDRLLLWSTLLGTTNSNDQLRLAEALRRFQIAVTNESIPSEEPPGCRE